MLTPNLNKKNIFSIPVGDYFDQNREDYQLIYAPLTENVFIALPQYVRQMEEEMAGSKKQDTEIAEVLNTLIPEGDFTDYIQTGVTDRQFNTLSILPNNICNFSCSYCYSAQGRSGKKLTKETIETALTHFIDPQRISPSKLYISIFGGGEPFMTPDLIEYIVERSQSLARQHGFILRISMVTNGSLVNKKTIDLLKKYNISLTVSFEILEEIQNLQRGSFDIVSRNIKKLLQEGVTVRIRSTITKQNVKLQQQMVDTVIREYPGIQDIMMEEVTDPSQFENLDQIRLFYKDLLHNFNKACEYGKKYDKRVECSSFRNYNLLIDRFCPGELCLTPEGKYSICSRISSPHDPGYDTSIYGAVENEKVMIDNDIFNRLVNTNVYTKEKCQNCFTKWHCGGGCYAQQLAYEDDILNVICDYKREYTKLRLLKDLDDEYQELYGKTLKDFINENSNN